MESILAPGIFSAFVRFLDDTSIARLQQQSTLLNQLISKEQESNVYWKSRVQRNLRMRIPVETVLNWKEVYRVIKVGDGRLPAVVEFFPADFVLSYIQKKMDPRRLRKMPLQKKLKSIENFYKEILRFDRVDVLDGFRQLLIQTKAPSGFKWVISKALKSDGNWKILTYLIPEIIAERKKLTDTRKIGFFVSDLLSYAALSTNIAHFILIEKLFEADISEYTNPLLTLRSILKGPNLTLLAYYSQKRPLVVDRRLVRNSMLGVRTPISYTIASFIIQQINDLEFETYLNKVDYLLLSEGTLEAVLKEPRMPSKTVESIKPMFYDYVVRYANDKSKIYARLLNLDSSKIIEKMEFTQAELIDYSFFKWLLSSKKFPNEIRYYVEEILKMKYSGLVCVQDPTEIFTLEEATTLARYLISKTKLSSVVKEYYTAKIDEIPLDPEVEKAAIEVINRSVAR